VEVLVVNLPRVARSSQPWALSRNPVGILPVRGLFALEFLAPTSKLTRPTWNEHRRLQGHIANADSRPPQRHDSGTTRRRIEKSLRAARTAGGLEKGADDFILRAVAGGIGRLAVACQFVGCRPCGGVAAIRCKDESIRRRPD